MPGEVFIATAKADKLPTQPPAPIEEQPDPSDAVEAQRIDLLNGVFAAVEAGEIDMTAARERSGLSQAQIYKLAPTGASGAVTGSFARSDTAIHDKQNRRRDRCE